jgi:DNA-binding MarR family transcriptional regulator
MDDMADPVISEIAPISHAILRVARAHRANTNRILRDVGLFPGQGLLMMTLWNQGPQRMVDLRAVIDADAPSISRHVAKLEELGLVRRAPSVDDRRVNLIEATESSHHLRARLREAWIKLEDLTVAHMTDAQRRSTLASLVLLEDALSDREELTLS